jgi:uncharacterized protein
VDTFFLYAGQQFCWNSTKAAANLADHGIAFEQACEVFFDPFVRIVDASAPEEMRAAAIGLSEDWTMLFVVHVIPEGTAIRIISAREATREERREYEEEL